MQSETERQLEAVRRFYRGQAPFYDATRWAFLFGRDALIRSAPFAPDQPQHLVEVGCGSGRNLARLAARYPHLRLTGVDISPDMLRQAKKRLAPYGDRVQWIEKPYGQNTFSLDAPADIVLFSYSLSMFNPGWEDAVLRAYADLKPGGCIAVADFHTTDYPIFRQWLKRCHVRLDAHLLPYLKHKFVPLTYEIRPGWGGAWKYFIFVGKKAPKG